MFKLLGQSNAALYSCRPGGFLLLGERLQSNSDSSAGFSSSGSRSRGIKFSWSGFYRRDLIVRNTRRRLVAWLASPCHLRMVVVGRRTIARNSRWRTWAMKCSLVLARHAGATSRQAGVPMAYQVSRLAVARDGRRRAWTIECILVLMQTGRVLDARRATPIERCVWCFM